MLLGIDIGNSQIKAAVYDGESIRYLFKLPKFRKLNQLTYRETFKNWFDNENITNKIDDVIISSVVREATNKVINAVRAIFAIEPLLVSAEINLGGVKLLVDNPKEVGADRICGIVQACSKYKPPFIIIDMGTATTFDVVSKEGNFIGGSICAGVGMNAVSLATLTSLLPQVTIEKADRVIATSTTSNILSGTVIAHAAMVDGMIARIEKELGEKTTIIITGGYSYFVKEHLTHPIDYAEETLILDGLYTLYKMNNAIGN